MHPFQWTRIYGLAETGNAMACPHLSNGLNWACFEISQTSKIILTLGIVVLILLIRIHAQEALLRPPGPKPQWLIGNAIPGDRQWLRFDEWKTIYGDILHITVMGQPAVILGSLKAAIDLLDARGTIYSDRPPAIMAGELVGWARGLGYSPYNLRFREFRHTQESENKIFLQSILKDPDGFMEHTRQSTGSLILRLAYGYSVVQNNDPLVKIAEDAMYGFACASEPGAFWVDSFPILRYVPSWLPGAGFKTVARRMREDLERLYNVPFDYVRTKMDQGKALPSFTSSYLEEKKRAPTADEEEFIKAASVSLYSGGAETVGVPAWATFAVIKTYPNTQTPSSVTSFILAMTLNPLVQTRAQAELDAVIGSADDADLRLPTFTDREQLPYVNAIVKEVLRWNPSVPLGLPHMATEDDVYQGYRIKKGTIVWANIWSILQDESVYPDPFELRPERYLDENGRLRKLGKAEDPTTAAFGFGRRICPGLFLADNSIFLAIATMLYVFNISKARDQHGAEITPAVEYDGFISRTRPFKCSIQPRSPQLKALVDSSV